MTPKADTLQILQTVPGILAPARKRPKAARTAGRCDLPGVTSDARLLSCFLFQPPLRSPQRRAGTPNTVGSEWVSGGVMACMETGRIASTSRCLYLFHISGFRTKITPCHNCPQRLQHRISTRWRCVRMSLGLSTGHNGPHKGHTGFLRWTAIRDKMYCH